VRVCNERYIKCGKLLKIFREYMIMDGALDYLEAKLREDAPKSVKDAYDEYVRISNEQIEEKKKSPFI
jgi:hypothetical protein